jgi:hypothetical protein
MPEFLSKHHQHSDIQRTEEEKVDINLDKG